MTKAAEAQDFPYLRWQRFTNQLDPPYSPHYINSTAISNDGSRVIAGTFYHYYQPHTDPITQPQADETTTPPGEIAVFGTYCFDGEGKQLWVDQFVGFEGVYTVAISGRGNIAASGGWYKNEPSYEGFIRAYDVDGEDPKILEFYPPERVNSIALSHDGSTLVAGSDKLYVFVQADGVFPSKPVEIDLLAPSGDETSNNAQSVAVSWDGKWIIAGDLCGNVYLVENNGGTLSDAYVWSEAGLGTIHSVAMAANGDWFVVGGNNSTVYVFDPASISFGPLKSAGSYTLDTGGRVGWVAISADGTIVSAVGNQGTPGQTGGAVVLIQNVAGTLTKLWETATTYKPNCTSMDADATLICVSDGYNTPGTFSLFDGKTGAQVWQYPTPEMNWPMFISADGTGIAAGTDEGAVYYFTPGAA
jgi:WD40 repeat protein